MNHRKRSASECSPGTSTLVTPKKTKISQDTPAPSERGITKWTLHKLDMLKSAIQFKSSEHRQQFSQLDKKHDNAVASSSKLVESEAKQGTLAMLAAADRERELAQKAAEGGAKSPIDLTIDDDESGPSRRSPTPPISRNNKQHTPNIYPSLPTATLFDEGDLRPSNPTPPDEAPISPPPTPPSKPIRHLLPSRSRPPNRPDVKYIPSPKIFNFEARTPSHSPGSDRSSRGSVRSRSSDRLRRKRSSNFRGSDTKRNDGWLQKHIERTVSQVVPPNDPSAPGVNRRVRQIFSRPSREAEFKRQSVHQTGLDTKELLKKIIGTTQSTPATLEESIAPKSAHVYSPAPRRKIAEYAKKDRRLHTDRNIEDLVNDLLLSDAAVQERLAPKTPTSLDPARNAIVKQAHADPNFRAKCDGNEVLQSDLRRLKYGQWLNDSIINCYGAMIQARADADKDGEGNSRRKVHYFNSYFYHKLSTQGYQQSNLKRWTRKTDIFEKDVIIFPINLSNAHWTAGAIDFNRKRIEYYDSMGDSFHTRIKIFNHIREYLNAEHKEKKGGKPFDFDGWVDVFNEGAPQQDNGSDCGVFSVQTLESIARGVDLIEGVWKFGPKNMPYFRDLMVYEIKQTKLEPR